MKTWEVFGTVGRLNEAGEVTASWDEKLVTVTAEEIEGENAEDILDIFNAKAVAVIQRYNDTLRPTEKPRKLIKSWSNEVKIVPVVPDDERMNDDDYHYHEPDVEYLDWDNDEDETEEDND